MEELRIKSILKEQGRTMQDLADEIGINRVNLSNSLNGNPTLERLKQVAECLNVQLKDLFKDSKQDEIKISGFIKIDEEIYTINDFTDLEKLYLSQKK